LNITSLVDNTVFSVIFFIGFAGRRLSERRTPSSSCCLFLFTLQREEKDGKRKNARLGIAIVEQRKRAINLLLFFLLQLSVTFGITVTGIGVLLQFLFLLSLSKTRRKKGYRSKTGERRTRKRRKKKRGKRSSSNEKKKEGTEKTVIRRTIKNQKDDRVEQRDKNE
jgi:hypothetical protein